MSSRQTFTTEAMLWKRLIIIPLLPQIVTWMSQTISKKLLKITSFKQIYLQTVKKCIHDHTPPQTLSHITLKRSNNWINLPYYNFTNMTDDRQTN